MQFYYGQRVKCIEIVDGNPWVKGQIGTIVHSNPAKPSVLFDNAGKPGNPSLHGSLTNEGGRISQGVWNCYASSLIPLEELIGVGDLI